MAYNCPKCNNEFSLNEKFCKVCGFNIKENFILTPTCPKCNKIYPTGVQFCTNDGAKLVHPEKLIPECNICKQKYTDGSKFCPKDGGIIDVASEFKVKEKNNPQPSEYNSEYVENDYHQDKKKSIEENDYSKSNFNNNSQVFKYPKANLGSRFGALLIDGLILVVLSIPAFILIGSYIMQFYNYGYESMSYFNDSDLFLGLFFVLFPVLYTWIKDGMYQGQSIGKKAVGLMVVNIKSNNPCSISNSIGRNFLSGIISNIPYVGIFIEVLMALLNDQGRKLSDLGANTQVIELKHYKK